MRRWVALGAAGLLGAAAIAAIVVIARGNDERSTKPPAPVPHPAPKLERVRDLAARVLPGRRIALRSRPGGRVLATIGARTEFGSPQTLAVAFRKGDWIAVRSPAIGNARFGWTRARRLRLLRRRVRLEIDLSRRQLAWIIPHGALKGGRYVDVERDVPVAIGAPDTPTPVGDFYVTDKLAGADFGPFYGCCILALSGRQPNLPDGWSGGDRLAIHGSPTPTWGEAVSNGCLHADEADLRFLMRNVPLGTPVRIHA